MGKLLASYSANPSKANAIKLRDYDAKHPMARCMLTPDQSAALVRAVAHADHKEV